MLEQFKAIIQGRVQGVGYRFYAERIANQLGVKGYVKNLWNGEVEVLAQGDKPTLELFLTKLREGPRLAKVTDIKVEWQPITETYSTFDIDY
ncbi:MAG: acylphosphatase [bacterium]|nr:acylphosphatase [bacterium]